METSKLKELSKYVTDNYLLLSCPINSLDDAKRVIISLEEIENNLTELDYDIENTVGVFDLLNEYNVAITPEDERQLHLLVENYYKLKIKVILAIK